MRKTGEWIKRSFWSRRHELLLHVSVSLEALFKYSSKGIMKHIFLLLSAVTWPVGCKMLNIYYPGGYVNLPTHFCHLAFNSLAGYFRLRPTPLPCLLFCETSKSTMDSLRLLLTTKISIYIIHELRICYKCQDYLRVYLLGNCDIEIDLSSNLQELLHLIGIYE